MRTWIAPKGTKVIFSIESCRQVFHPSIVPANGRTVDQYEEILKKFLVKHKLPQKDGLLLKIGVDDTRWTQLLDDLEESRKNNDLCLRALWLEEPKSPGDDPDAWFQIVSGSYEFRSPRRTPEGLHFSWREDQHLASQRFRDAVTTAKLTGLCWLPLEDSSSADPMTWYQVYADHPIGRGLDHPLLDPTKIRMEESQVGKPGLRNAIHPARRWGHEVASRMDKNLREGIQWQPEIIGRMLRACPGYFRVAGPHRFVREFLPRTDFAYNSWGFNPPEVGESRFNFGLLCNARARKVLVDAGVVKPSLFESVATVPEAEAGSAILDREIRYPLPLPDFTSEEHAKEEARRLQLVSKRLPGPKATTFKSQAQARKALKDRVASGQWTPASETKEFQKILNAKSYRKSPKAWRVLAPLLPLSITSRTENGEHGIEWEMRAPHWNRWMGFDEEADPEDAPSRKDLILGETPYGDWYSIRATDPGMPDDAAVTHWDHETTCKHDAWSSVLEFVAMLVEELDRIAGMDERPTRGQ